MFYLLLLLLYNVNFARGVLWRGLEVNHAITLKAGVWACELCNWEIRTIISHLIRNTLRPQHSFSPPIAVPLSDWPKRRGRRNKQALRAFWLAAVTPLELLPGDLLAACQPHDPVTVAACCNENISVGGWIYRPGSIIFVPQTVTEWVVYLLIIKIRTVSFSYNVNIFSKAPCEKETLPSLRFVLYFYLFFFFFKLICGFRVFCESLGNYVSFIITLTERELVRVRTTVSVRPFALSCVECSRVFDLLDLLLLCIENVGATFILWAVVADTHTHTRTHTRTQCSLRQSLC